MSDFPKWLLALAGVSLLPTVVSPFFLFAAPGADGGFTGLLAYVGVQLFWLVPLLLFFVSLDRYRRGYYRLGIVLAALSALLAVGALTMLIGGLWLYAG